MKIIILVVILIFNTALFDSSVFKNNEDLNLEKFIKLDISKYKFGDVKKLFGDNYFTDKDLNKNSNKEELSYHIFLKKKNSFYKLTLLNDKGSAHLVLNLIDHKKKITEGSDRSYFKSCSEIRDKYKNQYGKSERYEKYDKKIYGFSAEYLNFQIPFYNYFISSHCYNLEENEVTLSTFVNKNKKDFKIMNEVSKITCDLTSQRYEHRYVVGNDSFFVIKKMEPKLTIKLFIDDYSEKIGRVKDYDFQITGEYKIFDKDKILVIEKHKDGNNTWSLNRINGNIELLIEIEQDSVRKNNKLTEVIGGFYKTRQFGNCQKTKNNTL